MNDSESTSKRAPGRICIIGMHRSGTSMVASLLRQRGLALGPETHLLGASESNRLGHFEHTGFLDINEALLKQLGGSWDKPPQLQPGWEHSPALNDLTSKARLLFEDFTSCQTWGWKDPRTTILLPFWRNLIPNLRFVICIRNPLEVVRSLAQRDGQSISGAAHLWRYYTCQAIQETAGYSRILTFYEDYFREPLDEVTRISAFCGLPNAGYRSPTPNAILGELRHQSGGTVELLDERSISIVDKALYLLLRALPTNNLCSKGSPTDNKDGRKDGPAILLRLIAELQSQETVLQLETAVGEKEQELNVLHRLMREESEKKDEQIIQLKDQNARLQAFADAVQRSLPYRFYKVFLKPLRARGTD